MVSLLIFMIYHLSRDGSHFAALSIVRLKPDSCGVRLSAVPYQILSTCQCVGDSRQAEIRKQRLPEYESWCIGGDPVRPYRLESDS